MPGQSTGIEKDMMKIMEADLKRNLEAMQESISSIRPKVEEKAARYNKDKLRYDLIPTWALQMLAAIYTFGAQKYDDDNWRKGLSYRGTLASLMRHLEKFRAGHDNDEESGLPHLAHVAWNAFALLEFILIHPELDDRIKWWQNPKRIGFDLDGVLIDFHSRFAAKMKDLGFIESSERFATHWRTSFTGFDETWDSIKHDPTWWEELPALIDGKSFPFDPVCYITHRNINGHAQAVSERWLEKHKFPARPVFAVSGDKTKVIQEQRLDLFVDDKFENFQEINTKTSCVCLLWDAPHNRKFPVGYLRVKSMADVANFVYNHDQRPFDSPAQI